MYMSLGVLWQLYMPKKIYLARLPSSVNTAMHWTRYGLYIEMVYKQVPRIMAYLRHVVNNNIDAMFMLQVLWD